VWKASIPLHRVYRLILPYEKLGNFLPPDDSLKTR
jgi:hypothetical protein